MAAGLQEPKSQDFSNLCCVMFANILLAKANHVVKFRIKVESVLKVTEQGSMDTRKGSLLAILVSSIP